MVKTLLKKIFTVSHRYINKFDLVDISITLLSLMSVLQSLLMIQCLSSPSTTLLCWLIVIAEIIVDVAMVVVTVIELKEILSNKN